MIKTITFLFIIDLALTFLGCQAVVNDDSFAIYLLAQDIPATELSQMDINQLVLQSKPLISSDDIVSYDETNHTIELTQAAYTRVQQIFPMPVKVRGIPFVVSVGKERIYTGGFWTPASSLSFAGVIIGQPLDPKGTTIQISLGYPTQEAFTENDPRTDPRIIKALQQDNKLTPAAP